MFKRILSVVLAIALALPVGIVGGGEVKVKAAVPTSPINKYRCTICNKDFTNTGTHSSGSSNVVTCPGSLTFFLNNYSCRGCSVSWTANQYIHQASCTNKELYVSSIQYSCSSPYGGFHYVWANESNGWSTEHTTSVSVNCAGNLEPYVKYNFYDLSGNLIESQEVWHSGSFIAPAIPDAWSHKITLNITQNGGTSIQNNITSIDTSMSGNKYKSEGTEVPVDFNYRSVTDIKNRDFYGEGALQFSRGLPEAYKIGKDFLGWTDTVNYTKGCMLLPAGWIPGDSDVQFCKDTYTLYAVFTTNVDASASNINAVYTRKGTTFKVNAEGGATVTYKWDGNTSTTPPIIKKVGTTTIDWTASKQGYDDTTGTNIVTITQRDINGASIVAPSLSDITYRDKLSESTITGGSVMDSEDGVIEGTWSFVEPDKILNAGTNTVQMQFTPTEGTNYSTIVKGVPVYVEKYTPVLNESNIKGSEIQWGDTIGTWGEISGATADVDGHWVWDDTSEVINEIGSVTRSAHFLPDNTANYHNGNSVDVTFNVVKRIGEVSVKPVVSEGTYEQVLSAISINGGIILDHDGQEISGTYTWKNPDKKLITGSHDYVMTFTPADTSTHEPLDFNVTVKTAKMNPVVTYPSVGDIIYEDTLSMAELSGGECYPDGTFSIENGDTVLNAGDEQDITLVFTPDDTDNYNIISTPAKINVHKHTQGQPENVSAERCGKTVWDDSKAVTGDDESGWVYTNTGKFLGTEVQAERYMEYTKAGEDNWIPCADGVTDLIPRGKYQIRWAETPNYSVSEPIDVEVLRGLYEYRITFIKDNFGNIEVRRYLEGQPLGDIVEQPAIRFWHSLGWYDKMGVRVDESYYPTENIAVMPRYQQMTEDEIVEFLAKEFNDKWVGKTIDDLKENRDLMKSLLDDYALLPEESIPLVEQGVKDLIQDVYNYYTAVEFMDNNPIDTYNKDLAGDTIGGAENLISEYNNLTDGVKSQCTDEYKEGVESIRDWIEKYHFLEDNGVSDIGEVTDDNIDEARDILNKYEGLRDGTKDKLQGNEALDSVRVGVLAYDFDKIDWGNVSNIEDKRDIVEAYDSFPDDVKDKIKEKGKVEDFRNQVAGYDFSVENTPITEDVIGKYDDLDEDIKGYVPADYTKELEDTRDTIDAEKFEETHGSFSREDIPDYEGLRDGVKDKLSQEYKDEVQDVLDDVAAEKFVEEHPSFDKGDLPAYDNLGEGVRDKIKEKYPDYQNDIEDAEREQKKDDFLDTLDKGDIDKIVDEWSSLPDDVKDLLDEDTKTQVEEAIKDKHAKDFDDLVSGGTGDLLNEWDKLTDDEKERVSDESRKTVEAVQFEEGHIIKSVNSLTDWEEMTDLLKEYEKVDETYVSKEYKDMIRNLQNDLEAFEFEQDNPNVTKEVLDKYDKLGAEVQSHISDTYRKKVESFREQLRVENLNNGLGSYDDYDKLSPEDKDKISDETKKKLAEEAGSGVHTVKDYENLPDWVKDILGDDFKKEVAEEVGKGVHSIEDYENLPDWVKNTLDDDFRKELVEKSGVNTLEDYEKLPDWAKDVVKSEIKNTFEAEKFERDNQDITVDTVLAYDSLPSSIRDKISQSFKDKLEEVRNANKWALEATTFEENNSPDVITTVDKYDALDERVKEQISDGYKKRLEETRKYKEALEWEEQNPASVDVLEKYENLDKDVKDYLSEDYKDHIIAIKFEEEHTLDGVRTLSTANKDRVKDYIHDYDTLTEAQKKWISEDYKLWIEGMRDELNDQDIADAFRIKWQDRVKKGNANKFITEFETLSERAREKTGMTGEYKIWCGELNIDELAGTINLSYKVSKGHTIVVKSPKGTKIQWLRVPKKVKAKDNGRIRGKRLGKCKLSGIVKMNGKRYALQVTMKVVKKGKIAGVPKYVKKKANTMVVALTAKKGQKLKLTLDRWNNWRFKKKRVKVNKKKGTVKFKKRGTTTIRVSDGGKKLRFRVTVK